MRRRERSAAPVAAVDAISLSRGHGALRFAPLILRLISIAFITVGIVTLVAANDSNSVTLSRVSINGIGHAQAVAVSVNPDFAPQVAAGVCMLIAGAAVFLRSLSRRFVGWWGYLIRPALMILCVEAIVATSIVVGNQSAPLHTDEKAAGTFFIVFPSLLLLFLLFTPSKLRASPEELAATGSTGPSPKKRLNSRLNCEALS